MDSEFGSVFQLCGAATAKARLPTVGSLTGGTTRPVVKVVMCSRGGGSASEVETHKNIDSVLHTKTTFQAHSIFPVSIQK